MKLGRLWFDISTKAICNVSFKYVDGQLDAKILTKSQEITSDRTWYIFHVAVTTLETTFSCVVAFSEIGLYVNSVVIKCT